MGALFKMEPDKLRLAREIYAYRRCRDEANSVKGLFGEPAWDILLDVFIGQMSHAVRPVSSVCVDAGVPPTTILRWLARLERDNLIFRSADEIDARRRFVCLTEAGLALMDRMLLAVGAMVHKFEAQ